MNATEREMAKLLVHLRENYNLAGIKTEFEAEGVRFDDFYRLKEIAMLAGIPITLKIGGCEAVTDIQVGKAIGVSYIMAPMIESAFAVKKFMGAMRTCYADDELEDVIPEINIETITGHDAFEKILALPEYAKIGGLAIGRKDMTHSMGLPAEKMDCAAVFSVCKDIFESSKKKYPDKTYTLGGINSLGVIQFLKKFPAKTVDQLEMRKMIFSLHGNNDHKLTDGLIKGLQFEKMWYENKSRYYSKISGEDNSYIAVCQKRIESMQDEIAQGV
jgi:hypothetical protein